MNKINLNDWVANKIKDKLSKDETILVNKNTKFTKQECSELTVKNIIDLKESLIVSDKQAHTDNL